ncbi:MAG: pre-peptidase C-terminal domain-containing protein [Tetrasphaera sp.]|nr:pre-peptidase C-terminal domain-containing protein [Tetrasphaera sp.]
MAVTAMAAAAGGASAASAGADPLTTPMGQRVVALLEGSTKFGPTAGPNPWTSFVPKPGRTDLPAWKAIARGSATARANSAKVAAAKVAASGTLPPPLIHDELEPSTLIGSNDTRANAERIAGFGTRANPRLRVLGSLAPSTVTATPGTAAPEDNGSIPLAGDTGIVGAGATTVSGEIGDGPHGSAGTGSGDFDFYRLQAGAGTTIDASTAGSSIDTLLFVFDSAGELVALNDDVDGTRQSRIVYDVPAAGTYYVAVGGFFAFPEDPFDSGSGSGADTEGPFSLAITAAKTDTDMYAVRLAAGDVLGASVAGGAHQVQIFRPDGVAVVGGKDVDATFLFPWNSPLPGGGNTTVSYVAEESGLYRVAVRSGSGAYDGTLEVYRPGTEQRPAGKVQTVFLDFDGGRINTGVWGGAGIRDLSPLSAFLGLWGIGSAREGALIDAITAQVRSNLAADPAAYGLNPGTAIRVVTSKDHPDIYGKPNVSRVFVGGTIAQSGIPTIGIAQYIDPGNYATEDQALVLLDVLAWPKGEEPSLNTYLRPSSNRVAFVAQGIGNVVSHEIGHLVGAYHTDNENDVACLIDAGGVGFSRLFGVGPDGIGGTADDVDVDFAEDTYIPGEGFIGLEDALNVVSWGFSRGKG